MPDFKIKCFSEYVLRTPLFPLSSYFELIENYTSKKAIELYQDSVKEAINLASPELREQLDRWASESSTLSDEKKTALELTFIKYIARMSSRCTPFGLFAGCSVGSLDAETNITLKPIENHKRFTQFDMQYWIAMLQDLAKREETAVHLKYFPNSSIYEIGDFFRYIEYKYIDTKREHTISALRKSDLLKQILSEAKSGISIDEMILFLADDESEKEDARAFVTQLISFQFLISELDAVVTGSDEWKRIADILHKVPNFRDELQLLQNLKAKLAALDTVLIPSNGLYEKIKLDLNRIGTDYEEKHLFQTDLNITAVKNNLNAAVSRKVLKAVQFLNGIQTQKEFQNMENFKKAFIERYESKEMPLTTVLDTEIGIGYLQNHDMNDTHEILENFLFRPKPLKEKKQVWTPQDFILQKKLHDCYINNDKNIVLTENDFPDFDSSLKNTPVTFSAMAEVINDDEIALTSSGNLSAAKLLGRFCNGNKDIHKLTAAIIKKEDEYHDTKILAEIVHIPESRTGNILKRPVLRKHEISYLCTSGTAKEDNLDLDDLYLSIKADKVVLRSKKHNKEVLPCLSNAHNFSSNSLPIYHFLCDLELQNKKPIFSFNWGILESHYVFFPRVIYNNIILCKAKWKIKKEEIAFFDKTNRTELAQEFEKWRVKRNIPRFANWTNFNNTLLFDFESLICIDLFIKSVKQKEEFFLEEFLFTEKSVVKNNAGDPFSNQIILSYYKEKV